MFCQNCGKEIKEEMKFCPSCGRKVVIINSEARNRVQNANETNSGTVGNMQQTNDVNSDARNQIKEKIISIIVKVVIVYIILVIIGNIIGPVG
jgi:uncharacterized membrane protein YvbJ